MPRIQAQSIAQHKTLTRKRILAVAKDLFSQWGYEDVTFGDVAAEMHIGRTTLYDYFQHKEDLLASLVEEAMPTVIEQIAKNLPDGPPTERLRQLVVSQIEFIVVEPTLGMLLHREVPKLGTVAQRRVAAAHEKLSVDLQKTYQQGVVQGMLKPVPYQLVGKMLHWVIMAAAQTLIDSRNPKQELEKITEAVTELLFTGLLAHDPDLEMSGLITETTI